MLTGSEICNLQNSRFFRLPVWKMKSCQKSKPTQKLKHANSILESFEYFCQISSKSIIIILSYTVSKFVHFFETQCRPKKLTWKTYTIHWNKKKLILKNTKTPLQMCNRSKMVPENIRRKHSLTLFIDMWEMAGDVPCWRRRVVRLWGPDNLDSTDQQTALNTWTAT